MTKRDPQTTPQQIQGGRPDKLKSWRRCVRKIWVSGKQSIVEFENRTTELSAADKRRPGGEWEQEGKTNQSVSTYFNCWDSFSG